jgi:hypothetical protein
LLTTDKLLEILAAVGNMDLSPGNMDLSPDYLPHDAVAINGNERHISGT